MTKSPSCRYCGSEDTRLFEYGGRGDPPKLWAWECLNCEMITEGWRTQKTLLTVLNRKPESSPITRERLVIAGYTFKEADKWDNWTRYRKSNDKKQVALSVTPKGNGFEVYLITWGISNGDNCPASTSIEANVTTMEYLQILEDAFLK
jgi:hypothetical protein